MLHPLAVLALASLPLLAQASQDCEARRKALDNEVERLRQQVSSLTESVAALSKQIGVTAPSAPAPPPPSPAGPASLKVILKTRYSKGHSCPITLDGTALGTISYPELEGKERTMEYSSGFLSVPPGSHRLAIHCTRESSSKTSEVYADQNFEASGHYTWHVKINVWTKALQLEEFTRDE